MGFYEKNQWWIIDLFNKSQLTSKIFVFLKQHIKKGDFRISSLPTVIPIEDSSPRPRYTIILPSVRKSKVFGGINTALKFFNGLIAEADGKIDGRIVVMSSEKYSDDLTINMNGFTKSDVGKSLIFLADTKKISVRENEIFIFTTCGSAYVFHDLFKWQRKHYKKEEKKAIYFIQDFEPGFAAWSAWYALADSTYRNDAENILAVFNSKELYDYFKFNKYHFAHELYFYPSLNETLKKILIENTGDYRKRKKQIIFYGRPNEQRNAYEIVRYTLAKWSESYKGASEWEIFSLGAPGTDVKLKNNVIINKGKLTLEEYAKYMQEAYIGISLMISPHPSYPPLEMSTYGVKTITNSFANKNLTGFNDNLYCCDQCTPESLLELLSKLCDSYGCADSRPSLNKEYFDGQSFKEAIKKTSQLICAPDLK